MDLVLDENTTVLLGANDHGKSNVLAALTHLNEGARFDDEDLAWDLGTSSASLPTVEWTFRLDDEDRRQIRRAQELTVLRHSSSDESATASEDEEVEDEDEPEPEPELEAIKVPGDLQPWKDDSLDDITAKMSQWTELTISRTGVGMPRRLAHLPGVSAAALGHFVARWLPRVEVIAPVRQLMDAASLATIDTDEAEFMRGIFWFAGIDPDEQSDLFTQTDETARRLEEASAALDATLQDRWSQGSGLRFLLGHDSAKKEIQLRIRDDAVSKRYVRASRRSTGFTSFFSMTTVLHARSREHPANSYLWLFDEPGLNLHPSGQHDLLRVFEALAADNQVVYTTHSLFLINKNHPTRHRLLVKDRAGTRLDGKPYSSNWRATIAELGMGLPGTILFASRVLLVEGDSDPVLINALLTYLIDRGVVKVDINSLAIVATGESRNTDAILRVLTAASIAPRVGALFDGDAGGKQREKELTQLMDSLGCQHRCLPDKNTTESYLIDADRLYPVAVAQYVAGLLNLPPDQAADLKTSIAGAASDGGGSLVDNALAAGKSALGLPRPPSKVGVAREYDELLRQLELPGKAALSKPLRLVQIVSDLMDLPETNAPEVAVFEPGD